MFNIISLAPLAPFYASTDYLGEQYKRIEHPFMPLLYHLCWYTMLKMETHMRSPSKVINVEVLSVTDITTHFGY
jgi:hypothetical protein